MAHFFESGFFVAQPAWHQLGTVLQQPPTTTDAIAQAQLDWQVLEDPIYQSRNHGETVLLKKLVRDRDQKVLGIVQPDYVPLQNSDAFRWFDPFLEAGQLELNAAGSLKEGTRIWILAKLKNVMSDVLPNDPVQPYLLLHNSHDGSTAVWLQFTPVRVVCWNTLSGAARHRFGDLWQRKAICLPHSLDLQDQLERLQDLVNLTRCEFGGSVDEYKAMAHHELNRELLREYLGMVLQTNYPERHPAWAQLIANFEQGRGNHGKTLWDAYNAVTEWIEHQWGQDATARLESNWFGAGARLRTKAHQGAIAMMQTPQRISPISDQLVAELPTSSERYQPLAHR